MFILITVQKWPQTSSLHSHQNSIRGRFRMLVDLERKGRAGNIEACFSLFALKRLLQHPNAVPFQSPAPALSPASWPRSDDTAAGLGCCSRNWPRPAPSEPPQIKDVDKTDSDNRKHIFGWWIRFLVRLEDCSRYSGSLPSILPHSLLWTELYFPALWFSSGLA